VKDENIVNTERYRQIQVETATTIDLVQMAYNGIIENLNQAIDSLQTTPKSYDLFNEKMAKAQEIVLALDDGLDDNQGELSGLLASFYGFVRKELIESNNEKSIDRIAETINVVEQVRDYWASTPLEEQSSNSTLPNEVNRVDSLS
jgi:flagellar biosynthetic protein FliS